MSFLLLCFASGAQLELFLTLGVVIGGIVVGLFAAFYTALWRGEIPWRRSGPPIVAAVVWTLAISLRGVEEVPEEGLEPPTRGL